MQTYRITHASRNTFQQRFFPFESSRPLLRIQGDLCKADEDDFF